MILDSSALIAIVRREEGHEQLLRKLATNSEPVRLGAATYVECSIVAKGFTDPVIFRRLEALLRELKVIIEPFTARQAEIARQAHADYGRGTGHAAKLNFGDCLVYGLAIEKGEPLLFKGDDFIHTDVQIAE